jgi:hypothetical protein
MPARTERKREQHDDRSNTCADSAMCPFLVHDMIFLWLLTEWPPTLLDLTGGLVVDLIGLLPVGFLPRNYHAQAMIEDRRNRLATIILGLANGGERDSARMKTCAPGAGHEPERIEHGGTWETTPANCPF